MANLNPFNRPPKIDWDKLEVARVKARAALDEANSDQKRLALAVSMGEPGAMDRMLQGRRRVQESLDALRLADDAIDGATDLQAAHAAAEAAREQAEADKRAKADLAVLVKLAEEGERLLATYAEWYPKALAAWNAVQPHLVGNRHLREDMASGHPMHQQVPLELTRLSRALAERPDMLPPGANVRALGFAHEIEPIGKVYRTMAANAFRSKS